MVAVTAIFVLATFVLAKIEMHISGLTFLTVMIVHTTFLLTIVTLQEVMYILVYTKVSLTDDNIHIHIQENILLAIFDIPFGTSGGGVAVGHH